MKVSLILLQAGGSYFSFFDRYYTFSPYKTEIQWIGGIVAFFIIRALFQWVLGITEIVEYHKQNNSLLSQQNLLLQKQIQLMEELQSKH